MGIEGIPFVDGESCLLFDHRGKQHLIRLSQGSEFHFDRGVIPHDSIIGSPEGGTVTSSGGTDVVVLRPRLADYVLKMKRGAAVMYPKDTGAVVTWADIRPGSLVLEAGTGSGAMTLALSRAVGEQGRVVTVDTREDHQTHAKRLVEQFAGTIPPNIEFLTGDVVDHVADVGPDRVVLDLPEPWHCVEVLPGAMRPGGALAAYLPTVPQVEQLRRTMNDTHAFLAEDTFEVMMRSWKIAGRSVRPDHRMVGHTGFITVARLRSMPGADG